MMLYEYDEDLQCLDQSARCSGEVGVYPALSGSGIGYARCEGHYAAYVERVQPRMDEIRSRYPDTDVPPAWFDPTIAGERWNEDD